MADKTCREIADTYYASRTIATELNRLRAENEQLKDMIAKLDGQLGQRPCQLGRCIQFAELRGENCSFRNLLLDIRQHQGHIQPYIASIDAALRGGGE